MRTILCTAIALAALLCGSAEAQNFANGQNIIGLQSEPPGGIAVYTTSVAANTSTQIAPANVSRVAYGIQCASGGVSISETGATLTSAGVGSGSLFMPAGTAPYFTPPLASQTAVTAYTATAQTCVVTEYLR